MPLAAHFFGLPERCLRFQIVHQELRCVERGLTMSRGRDHEHDVIAGDKPPYTMNDHASRERPTAVRLALDPFEFPLRHAGVMFECQRCNAGVAGVIANKADEHGDRTDMSAMLSQRGNLRGDIEIGLLNPYHSACPPLTEIPFAPALRYKQSMMKQQPPRIVSLIASATEIVCALGARDQLVGRSHECDFPPDVEALPALTEPKFSVKGSSGEIDQRVKTILEQGTSVYRVFADELKALAPDVIVTQDQCEVCAVSLRDVEAAVCEWVGAPANLVSLKPDCLADIWKDIQRVGDALGRPDDAHRLIGGMQERMNDLATRAHHETSRPKVACIEWVDPLMAAGNWMPELVEMAHGENVFGEAGKHSPWIEWDAIRAADPDIIVILPCGYDLPRTLEDAELLNVKPGYSQLKAVRNGHVYAVDGNQYFNRPGPRIADSLDILCQIMRPALFGEKDRGCAWLPCA